MNNQYYFTIKLNTNVKIKSSNSIMVEDSVCCWELIPRLVEQEAARSTWASHLLRSEELLQSDDGQFGGHVGFPPARLVTAKNRHNTY